MERSQCLRLPPQPALICLWFVTLNWNPLVSFPPLSFRSPRVSVFISMLEFLSLAGTAGTVYNPMTWVIFRV